jgi:cell wall-associated NlpC family hydrolase
VTYRPLPVRLSGPLRGVAAGLRRRQAPSVLIGITAALLAAVPAIADPSQVQHKQAQANAVLAQIDATNSRLGKAVESYNLANVKLQKIRRDLADNKRMLEVARTNLKIGQKHVAQRVVQLYTTGGESGTLDVILGAQSLDDLLNRLDTVDRVSNLDAQVIKEVRTFRAASQKHARLLREARAAQERVVAERAAKKQSIEGQLTKLHRLEASIKDELDRLRAQERARQLNLARAAQARLQALQFAQQGRSSGIVGASADNGGTPVDGATPAPPPSQYSGAVGVAMAQLGKPYVWAAGGPSSFDCSGLVVYAFSQVGVSLPHSSYALWGSGAPVSRDQLEPGDLVFFDGLGHVGIYIGGGQFVHAPHSGDVVKISSLGESWYASTYVGARRI